MPSSPTPQHVHAVDVPLTNFAQRAIEIMREDYVADRVMGTINVAQQSNRYYVYDAKQFKSNQAKKRAPGTKAAEINTTLTTDTYLCETPAVSQKIPEEVFANADDIINVEQDAVTNVVQTLLTERETNMNSTFLVPDVFHNGSAGTSSGDSVNWSTGNPRENIINASRAVKGYSGRRPNTILMGEDAWDTLRLNDEIVALISGGATTSAPAIATRELVARALGVDNIYVSGATNDSGHIVTSGNVLLYWRNPVATFMGGNTGAVFNWSGFVGASQDGIRIKSYFNDEIDSQVYKGQMAYDMKVTGPEFGYLFLDVTS